MDDEAERALARGATTDPLAAEELTFSRLRSMSGTVLVWPADHPDEPGGSIPAPMPGCVRTQVQLPGKGVPVWCWTLATTSPEDVVRARLATPAGCGVGLADLKSGDVVALDDGVHLPDRAEEGWTWPTARIVDPVRGEVRLATWIRGRGRRRQANPHGPQPPPAHGLHDRDRAGQDEQEHLPRRDPDQAPVPAAPGRPVLVPMPAHGPTGARPSECPLWERAVFPAGPQKHPVAEFFCGVDHPDGTRKTPMDLGPLPLRGCMPPYHHMFLTGVSVQADMDADPDDVAQLGSSTLEFVLGPNRRTLAQLSVFGRGRPAQEPGRPGTLAISLGTPVVLSMTVRGNRRVQERDRVRTEPTDVPFELQALEAFRFQVVLRDDVVLRKKLGLTCSLHGTWLRPIAY